MGERIGGCTSIFLVFLLSLLSDSIVFIQFGGFSAVVGCYFIIFLHCFAFMYPYTRDWIALSLASFTRFFFYIYCLAGAWYFCKQVQFSLFCALTGYDAFPDIRRWIFSHLVFSPIPFFSYLTGRNLYHTDTSSRRLSSSLAFLLAISSSS